MKNNAISFGGKEKNNWKHFHSFASLSGQAELDREMVHHTLTTGLRLEDCDTALSVNNKHRVSVLEIDVRATESLIVRLELKEFYLCELETGRSPDSSHSYRIFSVDFDPEPCRLF